MTEQTIWPAVVGGCLAISGAVVATWLGKFLEHKFQERQLARAICGELSAICRIVSLRGYVAAFRNQATLIQHTGQTQLFSVKVVQEYCGIYKANTSKVGNLAGNLPKEVSIIYTQIFSVFEDFSSLNSLVENPDHNMDVSPDTMIRRYTAIADLVEDSHARAIQVCLDIDKKYSGRCWWM